MASRILIPQLQIKTMLLAVAAAAKSLQSCPTLCNLIEGSQPTRLPHPWDSLGKNTGVGCHFLLRSMKVKSQSEVTQSCPTLSGPMDCSLPGSSVHGIFQASVLEWGAIVFSGIGMRRMSFRSRPQMKVILPSRQHVINFLLGLL